MKIGLTRENIKSELRKGIRSVAFTKKDGTTRLMRATLLDTYIPEEHVPKGSMVFTETEDHPVRVYDLDAKGWRSFLVSNVTSVKEL